MKKCGRFVRNTVWTDVSVIGISYALLGISV